MVYRIDQDGLVKLQSIRNTIRIAYDYFIIAYFRANNIENRFELSVGSLQKQCPPTRGLVSRASILSGKADFLEDPKLSQSMQ